MKSRGRVKHRWQVCVSQCPEKPVAGSRLRVQVDAPPADVGPGGRDRAAVTHEEMMPQCRGSRGRGSQTNGPLLRTRVLGGGCLNSQFSTFEPLHLQLGILSETSDLHFSFPIDTFCPTIRRSQKWITLNEGGYYISSYPLWTISIE